MNKRAGLRYLCLKVNVSYNPCVATNVNIYHFLVFLLYHSQVSILGPVGYGPTTLPLRHSDLLERRMSYCDLCSRVIYDEIE